MKCSEYLWKYIDLQARMGSTPGWSPERTQGELRLAMEQNGDTIIESDTTGEKMTEREARSVLGRNEKELWAAYREGNQTRFALITSGQQRSDDDYYAAKKKTEKDEESVQKSEGK